MWGIYYTFSLILMMETIMVKSSPQNPNQYHIQTDEGPERFFRYVTLNGQYRKEKRLEDGTVIGSYGWVDDDGMFRLKDYIADSEGYRIVKTNNIYVGKQTPISIALRTVKKSKGNDYGTYNPDYTSNNFVPDSYVQNEIADNSEIIKKENSYLTTYPASVNNVEITNPGLPYVSQSVPLTSGGEELEPTVSTTSSTYEVSTTRTTSVSTTTKTYYVPAFLSKLRSRQNALRRGRINNYSSTVAPENYNQENVIVVTPEPNSQNQDEFPEYGKNILLKNSIERFYGS